MRARMYSAWRSDAAVLFRCSGRGSCTRDEDGMELISIEAAWGEAALSLADLAMDAIAMSGANLPRRQTSIEVRDDSGPVLVVTVTFV
jgi:hypothetical protein